MKLIPAILFFTLFVSTVFCQQTIKGRVVNETTGVVIPGSSVFISNTSKGTSSDNDGYFILTDVPTGKHELIVSSIGYETAVFSFNEQQLPLQLKVQLQLKVKELETVLVEPSVEQGWNRWGKVFMDNFIGNTANAAQCRILNEKAIHFRYYKKSNKVVAYCDEPVLLENKALGYKISYQLEGFEVNFTDRTTFFLGYSLFEPLADDVKPKWEKKRKEAYSGSIMHFMRSLYNNNLFEEGFEVRVMQRNPNVEKQRVNAIYKSTLQSSSNINTGQITIHSFGFPDSLAKDSVSYYQSVMQQADFIDIYGKNILTADSLIIKSEATYKWMHFPDYLYIVYKNEKEEEGYFRMLHQVRQAGFQRSYVILLGDKLISFDDRGNYYNPQDFFASGYWGWSEKMASSLPLDYVESK